MLRFSRCLKKVGYRMAPALLAGGGIFYYHNKVFENQRLDGNTALSLKKDSRLIAQDNLDTLKVLTKKLTSNSLVIWDVEDVLMVAEDQIFLAPNEPIAESFYQKLEKKYGHEQYEKIVSKMLLQRRVQLVDKDILEVFQVLRNRNIKSMGLTNGWTGRFGEIKHLEDWKIAQLKALGINFNQVSPTSVQICLHNMPVKFPGRHPLFKQGILFSCGIPKGEVLKEFLNRINARPDAIIFIDNKIEHIYSVALCCKSLNIPFLGIHYTAALSYLKPFEPELSMLQFKILETDNIWISDSAIKGKDAKVNKKWQTK